MMNLGDVVRDRVTGFEGVVVAETRWLHGCRRLTVQPQHLHDGKPIESHGFDEPQLELVAEAVVPTTNVERAALRPTGGPRPEPARRAEPRRR